jgi:hypothetical protein
MKHCTFFALVLAFFACKPPLEVIEPTIIVTDFSIIDGDTVKTRKEKDFKRIKEKDPQGKNYIVVGDTVVLYKAPKLHTPPAKDPDLSKLKNNDDPDLKGKPLRMVAIGGSLTAGVRDGGYFNEGILTSYPNLIARQMKLKKFEQPLFDAQDYNGFGRKVRTGENWTGGPVPKFKAADNNSGVEYVDEKEVKLKKARNLSTLDNFSVPFLNEATVMSEPESFDSDRTDIPTATGKHFVKRILPTDKKITNLAQHINTSKYDLMIVDIWSDDFINNMRLGGSGGFPVPYSDGTTYTEKVLTKITDGKKTKVALVNIPDITSMFYFKTISKEILLKGMLGQKYIYYVGGANPQYVPESKDVYLPTSAFDTLASPNVHLTLKKGLTEQNPINGWRTRWSIEGMNSNKLGINSFNTVIKKDCDKYGFALVDLHTLYKKIIEGNYTEDGIRLDPSFPNGNFFSSDGFYPTPLGQAVIANEVIRSLNATYKTEIPLIKISEYLEK